jgi:predicted peptidase
MRWFYCIIAVLIVSKTHAQDTALFKREIFGSNEASLNYRILYPSKYDVNKKYPLIIFLHGGGERGFDNSKQLIHGSRLFLDSTNRVKFPAFVIFPQCPPNNTWSVVKREPPPGGDSLGRFSFVSDTAPRQPMALVMELLDSLVQTPQVDTQQIYLGGLSMGGMGTFELLWRRPGLFAAAFPICGAGDPTKVDRYARNFPVWVFHGGADSVVPVSNSRLMVNKLREAGARVTYNEYPGVGHDSWTNAFAEPGLLPWLFEQKRTSTVNRQKKVVKLSR